MKRHHKIILSGFSIVVIIFMIVTGILLNTILVKIDTNYNSLDKKIDSLESDTQGKINTLTESIIETQNDILTVNQSFKQELGDFKTEFAELKASAGEDFSGIIEDSVESVVTIITDVSQGTGFLIADDGFIVTNYHVIEDARKAGVYTYDKEMHQVTLIGANTQLD